MLRIATRRTLATGQRLMIPGSLEFEEMGYATKPKGGWKPPNHADAQNFWNQRSNPDYLKEKADIKGNYEKLIADVEARSEEFAADPRGHKILAGGILRPVVPWETSCKEEAVYHYRASHRHLYNAYYEIADSHGETLREDQGIGLWAYRIFFGFILFKLFIGGQMFGLRLPRHDDFGFWLFRGPIPIISPMFGGESWLQMVLRLPGIGMTNGAPFC